MALNASPAATTSATIRRPGIRVVLSTRSYLTAARPFFILNSVVDVRWTVCLALFWSSTVSVSPCTAVIGPLIVLLSPSAAYPGSAARRATNAATNIRCFRGFLVFMSMSIG